MRNSTRWMRYRWDCKAVSGLLQWGYRAPVAPHQPAGPTPCLSCPLWRPSPVHVQYACSGYCENVNFGDCGRMCLTPAVPLTVSPDSGLPTTSVACPGPVVAENLIPTCRRSRSHSRRDGHEPGGLWSGRGIPPRVEPGISRIASPVGVNWIDTPQLQGNLADVA